MESNSIPPEEELGGGGVDKGQQEAKTDISLYSSKSDIEKRPDAAGAFSERIMNSATHQRNSSHSDLTYLYILYIYIYVSKMVHRQPHVNTV